jgi:hypothetical protein
MRRLDRIAGEINPFLIILVVGLVILTLVRLATLGLSNIAITKMDASCMMPWRPQ